MKRLFLPLAMLAFTVSSVFGQEASTGEDKLAAAFTPQQLASLTTEDMAWKAFLADNMCLINPVSDDKAANMAEINLGTQQSATSETFNPFLQDIQPLENEHQYFRIAGTDKTLFVYSKARLLVLYERYKQNHKN
jgi:hypothetical protein